MHLRHLDNNWLSRGIRKRVSTFIGLMVLSSIFAVSAASQSTSAASVVTKTAKHFSDFQLRPVLSEKANPKTTPCPSQAPEDSGASILQACSADGKTLFSLGAVTAGSIDVQSGKLVFQKPQPVVLLVFNGMAAKHIFEVTTQITVLPVPKNELAIIVAGRVLFAPRVNQAISGGQIEVSFGTSIKADSFFRQLTSGYTPETPCNKLGQKSKSGAIVLQCQKWGANERWMVVSN